MIPGMQAVGSGGANGSASPATPQADGEAWAGILALFADLGEAGLTLEGTDTQMPIALDALDPDIFEQLPGGMPDQELMDWIVQIEMLLADPEALAEDFEQLVTDLRDAGPIGETLAGLIEQARVAQAEGDESARERLVVLLNQVSDRLSAESVSRPDAPGRDERPVQVGSNSQFAAATTRVQGETERSIPRAENLRLDRIVAEPERMVGEREPVQFLRDPVQARPESRLPAAWAGGAESSSSAARADLAGLLNGTLSPLRSQALPPQTPASPEARAAAEQTFERVAWMSRREGGQARLQLRPPELGQVDIRVKVQGKEASIQMSAANAQVREALEQMLPRLRELLEGQGLHMSDASVADSGTGQAGQQGDGQERSDSPSGQRLQASDEAEQAASRPTAGQGLLDLYA
ncbi:flagellar hook-length control protein FliK [Wenzhouxiangella sp. AB-CW3]|uniref:flagellar hook-length control protein FliK n=1 Tax=Wenzhouxiangella sp. AB-CW3 TaxID=2771012 RepID=UPI00168AF8E3|nr:flagellar hook-length control protein FliK [Wenzhouxiangella sp. AB-CW3]QOC21199.1 flagellar hook-length control protein FliK [Wenzhouxiangella sp. AB-CW3]